MLEYFGPLYSQTENGSYKMQLSLDIRHCILSEMMKQFELNILLKLMQLLSIENLFISCKHLFHRTNATPERVVLT